MDTQKRVEMEERLREAVRACFEDLDEKGADMILAEVGEGETVLNLSHLGLWVAICNVEVRTILGTRKVPGYAVGYYKVHPSTRWDPEEYEDVETLRTQRLSDAVVELARLWVSNRVEQLLLSRG